MKGLCSSSSNFDEISANVYFLTCFIHLFIYLFIFLFISLLIEWLHFCHVQYNMSPSGYSSVKTCSAYSPAPSSLGLSEEGVLYVNLFHYLSRFVSWFCLPSYRNTCPKSRVNYIASRSLRMT